MRQRTLEGRLKKTEEDIILTGLAAEWLIKELEMMAPAVESVSVIKESLESTGMFKVELGPRAIGIRSIEEHRWENNGWFILRVTANQKSYSVWIWDSRISTRKDQSGAGAEPEDRRHFSDVEGLLHYITDYCSEFAETYSGSSH